MLWTPVEGNEYRPGHVFYSRYELSSNYLILFIFIMLSDHSRFYTILRVGPPIPSPLRLSDACLDY
jgi:hypothetical protein